MEKMSSIIRREFKKGDDIRDAGLTAPDDVIRYKDIAYGTSNLELNEDEQNKLDNSCKIIKQMRKENIDKLLK